MNTSSAGPSSKSKAGSSQPSETSFKRKRGTFQKECEYLKWVCFVGFIATILFYALIFFLDFTVQHMMYGFGDGPNVSSTVYLYLFCAFGLLQHW